MQKFGKNIVVLSVLSLIAATVRLPSTYAQSTDNQLPEPAVYQELSDEQVRQIKLEFFLKQYEADIVRQEALIKELEERINEAWLKEGLYTIELPAGVVATRYSIAPVTKNFSEYGEATKFKTEVASVRYHAALFAHHISKDGKLPAEYLEAKLFENAPGWDGAVFRESMERYFQFKAHQLKQELPAIEYLQNPKLWVEEDLRQVANIYNGQVSHKSYKEIKSLPHIERIRKLRPFLVVGTIALGVGIVAAIHGGSNALILNPLELSALYKEVKRAKQNIEDSKRLINRYQSEREQLQ